MCSRALLPGRSVPLSRATWYTSAGRIFFHSSSLRVTLEESLLEYTGLLLLSGDAIDLGFAFCEKVQAWNRSNKAAKTIVRFIMKSLYQIYEDGQGKDW